MSIDATWGIPDSLMFHPHDSYDVRLADGRVDRYLRCKTDFVDVESDGGWTSRPAGASLDWKPALTNAEAQSIARMSQALADHLGEATDTMFFVLADPDASNRILPWFFQKGSRPPSRFAESSGFYLGEKLLVRDRDDLRRVADGGHSYARRPTIQLQPSIELLRSRQFIQEVADVAKRLRLPVELAGSQLAHAYYILEDAGVGVRCVDPWRRPERRRTFGKLVRDLIPVKIERHGEFARVYHAQPSELQPLVKAKIIEEAFEHYWADDQREALEELADLLELVDAAARTYGSDLSAVQAIAEKKRGERGGFAEGVVLVETTEASEGSTFPIDATRSRRLRQNLLRRAIRQPNRRLILPLAPSMRWRLGRTETFPMDRDEELAVTYTRDGLHLQVRDTTSGPDPAQSPLPGF